jgi:hypothetical protein
VQFKNTSKSLDETFIRYWMIRKYIFGIQGGKGSGSVKNGLALIRSSSGFGQSIPQYERQGKQHCHHERTND